MSDDLKLKRLFRWTLSVLLVVVGLSTTWAWGQVARLAEPLPAEEASLPAALYAAWQPEDSAQPMLFRSIDEGGPWQSLALPEGAAPAVWAADGLEQLAVVADDGSLFRSKDRGDSWTAMATDLPILSLAWGEAASLYLGTDGQGIYRLSAGGTLAAIAPPQGELASARVQQLVVLDGRLFAATPTVLFHTDDDGETWVKSLPVSGGISALMPIDRETILVGTQVLGVYKSTDAGQAWQPALEGLGLAAGQMVRVTALRADPQEPGLLYAAVDHLLGSTEVHASAAGTFVTLDGGLSWQPMAGPAFPEARHTSELIVVAGKPLYVQAMTPGGLQQYGPDLPGSLAALSSDEPQERAAAARMLGLARAREAGEALLSTLNDSDPAVSLAAANALGRINDPAIASGLLVALQHPDDQVRLGAARALGMLGVEGAVEPLRSMLLTGEGPAVNMAAEALGRIGSPAAADALLAALADPEMTPRRHAAQAALEAMGETAVGPLMEMLDSQNVYARRNAAQALGWIGSPSATAMLVETLEDSSAVVRRQAAWALGEIGDLSARAALERAQQRDPVDAVQAEAGAALMRIEKQPEMAARWPASWAPALSRFQALRWLVLALSLAGAAWLAVANTRPSLLPAFQRVARR
jgi:HEAT repeat protein